MGCQFWLNSSGQLIADDNGTIMYSEDCPCGECCERLAEKITALLAETTQKCVPCDQVDWNVNCGECEIPDPNPDPENPMTQLGELVTKRKNRIVSLFCDTGFYYNHPETPPESDSIIEVSFCNGHTATTAYYGSAITECVSDEPCCIFTHVYCPIGEEGSEKLYPIIYAPDLPSTFNSGDALCNQQYWTSCFSPTPVSFVKCGAQIFAPRCWFEDYSQPEGQEPDFTYVWGVIGCFCEGQDKWKIKSICGGNSGNGLIIVDAPFQPDTEPLLDENGDPVVEDGIEIYVTKCEITCEGSKGLVEEMTHHYLSYEEPKFAIWATDDVNEWNDKTGQSQSAANCFWGYIPLGTVYAYICRHYNENHVLTTYWHYVIFDCDCNISEMEIVHNGNVFPNGGLYEVSEDICDSDCPALLAIMAYAKGENMNKSQVSDTDDPRDTGDGGVVLQEDSRAPGSGIYSIGGTPCLFAAWSTDKHLFIWVDCNCQPHVNCLSTGTEYKFLKSVDPCICIDFRELVDANPSLFGVVDKQWGSHSIVHWEHTDSSYNYTGPYWSYNGTQTYGSHECSVCDTGVEGVTIGWYVTKDPFIDYNMLVVHRIVLGEHEIGHVNKSGGITNYRLQANGASMSGLTTADFGYTNPWGDTQTYAYINDGHDISYYCNSSTSGLAGYYYIGTSYRAYCAPSGSLWCPCPDEPPDPLPICQDHSRTRSIEAIFCDLFERSIISNSEMTCFNAGSTKTLHAGEYKYVRNQTTCEDICTHWEPGYYTWNVFMGEFINTSCGILINSCSGSDNYIQNVGILGSTTIENTWAPKIQSTYGWYDDCYTSGGYPSSNTTLNGGYFTEIRNTRGTLISYQAYFMPSGYLVHDVQPPKCHESNCNGKVVYADVTAFCQANPSDDSCTCYNSTSGESCVSPSTSSN